jgi:hypothetical protein
MERHPDSASPPGFRADPSHAQTAPARNWLHRLVNFAVAVAVLAVAAGTFFLSYPGVHAIARQGGVSGQLARFYPALFDAVLLIACVAAVMLRDSRWWARGWAWLVAIVVLGAIGATDVLHAMSYGLRQRPTEGVVAAAPVAAVLLAFSLFLTMLRQSRPQPTEANRGQAPDDDRAAGPMMFPAVDTVPVRVLAAGAAPRPPAPPIALPVVPADAPTVGGAVTDGADAAPTAPAAVMGSTEAAEPTPAREVPALAADASDTRDAGGSGDADGSGDSGDAGESGEDPGTAATRERPVLSATGPEAPEATHPPTDENEVVGTQAPTAVVAPEPTSEPIPAATAETADEASGESDEASEQAEPRQPEPPTVATGSGTATKPQAIRYASSAAAEQFANEDWEAEVDPALAGQVYPVLTSDPDIDVPPHQPGQSQDLEDDAPPFVTAPFASVPRLNRVRVTPTPPTDDADEE